MPRRTPLFFIPFLLATLACMLCACDLPWPADTPSSPDAVLANAGRETPLPLEEPALFGMATTTPASPTPASDAPETPPPAVPYTLLIEAPAYTPARYEPANGCYIGAYILADKTIGGSIRAFEQMAGKSHAIYVSEMTLGGVYPSAWVLECIAARKTPCIVIQRPNLYAPFDYDLLAQTAADVGSLNVPIFVQLFPFSKEEKYEREGYLAFYAEARRLFAEHAPQAALVWSADATEDAAAYYPGDENVDWVGVTVRDDFAALDAFIQAYQRRKPLMLTAFGVSHYTTEHSDYDMDGASARIAAAYESLAARYPRVKAVLYRNENELDKGLVPGEIRRDYTLTADDALTSAYQAAIADVWFLSALETEGRWGGALMQARYPAYALEDVYFVAEASITEDFGAVRLLPGTRAVSFDGLPCRDLAFARACVDLDFYVDVARGWLVVRLL